MKSCSFSYPISGIGFLKSTLHFQIKLPVLSLSLSLVFLFSVTINILLMILTFTSSQSNIIIDIAFVYKLANMDGLSNYFRITNQGNRFQKLETKQGPNVYSMQFKNIISIVRF